MFGIPLETGLLACYSFFDIVRMVVGNNHIYVIPGSILTGATILLLSDLFARVVISPVILPIGAITSFLGGPLFLYLLFKEGKRE